MWLKTTSRDLNHCSLSLLLLLIGRVSKAREEMISLFVVAERHNFFVNRVAPSWDILTTNVINSSNLNGFKAALDNLITDT